jgi:hypothetical protein
MRINDLRTHLERQPFVPFRLHLTDGTVFDVSHPDMAVLGHATLAISLPRALTLDRGAVIDLLHIMWLEVLNIDAVPPARGAGDGNGESSPPPDAPRPAL